MKNLLSLVSDLGGVRSLIINPESKYSFLPRQYTCAKDDPKLLCHHEISVCQGFRNIDLQQFSQTCPLEIACLLGMFVKSGSLIFFMATIEGPITNRNRVAERGPLVLQTSAARRSVARPFCSQ